MDEGTAANGVSPTRAGTGTVLGVMGLIALVSVALVVAGGRLAGAGSDDAAAEETEAVPTELAGGIPPTAVPAEVAAAVELPVVGAVRLDELPDGLPLDCGMGPGATDLSLVRAIVTPEQLLWISQGDFGEEFDTGGLSQAQCAATFGDNGWRMDGGGSMGPIDGSGGGMTAGCCDEEGRGTASASLQVPPEASWALQDRGSHYVAYPVDGDRSTVVSWTYRPSRFGDDAPPATAVIFVDGDGTVLEETSVGGRF